VSRSNLTFDGTYKYTYDAWNRLVKATLEDTDVVIQSAEFDGLGRRITKTVTNSGELDGTIVYFYNGHQIIETRDGSGNVESQVYHGTRYIDEVVGLRVKDQGRVYLHQDANWNVTAMTDLTGRIIERYWYSPYGELEAVVAAHPFDYDDDGDVDADDYAVTTNGTCSGAAAATGDCRRLDANADGVVNGDDRTVIAAYIATLDSDTELQRIPASTHSRRGNVFAHQGLVLDEEIASYQNRARQYFPVCVRFAQRDPLGDRQHFVSGYVDGLSLYAYIKLNPVKLRDPTGLIIPIGIGSALRYCKKKNPCFDCPATCDNNQALLGTDTGGVICRDDGCQCPCVNNAYANGGTPADNARRDCVLVHEQSHANSNRTNCDCTPKPCRQTLLVSEQKAEECTASSAHYGCLCDKKLTSCAGDSSCEATIENEMELVVLYCEGFGGSIFDYGATPCPN